MGADVMAKKKGRPRKYPEKYIESDRQKRLLKAEAKAELAWRAAKRDCSHFIAEHVHIEDRDSPGLAIPFQLWPKQQEALEAILGNRLTIILKARQLGLTWLALSYAVWKLIFNPGYAVVALSKREDDAKELVRRVSFILRYLPRWMVRHQKDGANFAGPVWDATTLTITITHPEGEPSTFTSMSSGPDSGRSFTASLVVLDEWAFQQWAREIWTAAYPTVNRPTGGQVIGLSTAKRGTLFEEIWDGAVSGDNTFKPIFLPWNSDPRRTLEWYEQTQKDLGDDYHAEYPETAEEAFMYSGDSIFPIPTVMERIKQVKAIPWKRGYIRYETDRSGDPIPGSEWFQQDEAGNLIIYEEPKPGYPYVIGGDTAEGGKDYCVGQVIDNTTGKQVAKLRCRTDTDLFAKKMFALGYYYNTALISIEINFDLHPIKELERLHYPRLYYREVIDDSTRRKERKHGWRTTTATRPPLIARLVSIVRDAPELITDLDTLNEMLTFIRDDSGKPQAVSGKHDDCILALAIAYAARDQQSYSAEPSNAIYAGGIAPRHFEDDDLDEEELWEIPGFFG